MSDEPSYEYTSLKRKMKEYLDGFDEIDLDLIDKNDFDAAFSQMLIEFTNKLGNMTNDLLDDEDDDDEKENY